MRRTLPVRFAVRQLSRRSLHAANAAQFWQRQRCTKSVSGSPSTLTSINVTSQIRFKSDASTTQHRPLTDRQSDDISEEEQRKQEIEARKAEQPSYQLTFTCKKCMERSSHRVSKQGYHHGTILINCPGCKNKHLISDHLGIFSDRGITLEDIMKEKGQLLRKGTLGADGDVEFYDEDAREQNTPSP